jgi:uncharacterized protein YjiS (DUF1127 family)
MTGVARTAQASGKLSITWRLIMNRTHDNHAHSANLSGLTSTLEVAAEPIRLVVEAIAAWRPLARLDAMLATSRIRHELRDLDDRMLKDIGVSRIDLEREIRRPFWDIDERLDG